MFPTEAKYFFFIPSFILENKKRLHIWVFETANLWFNNLLNRDLIENGGLINTLHISN